MNWSQRYAESKQRKGWCHFCGNVYDNHLPNCPNPDKLLVPDETGHIKGVD
jgi:predicted restriction endonuclease